MTIGQISNAKFPPKVHIQSGLAASKPSASSKIVGCLYHATNAVPTGGTTGNKGFGIVQLCKKNNATVPVPAWTTVSTPDLVGLVTMAAGTKVIANPGVSGIVNAQIKATTTVKYWVRGVSANEGNLSVAIVAGTSITINSDNPADTSQLYVEITY